MNFGFEIGFDHCTSVDFRLSRDTPEILIMFKYDNVCHDIVMDALVEPLEKTIQHKTKADAVKQEVDRNEDMIRSALRAIDSLNRIR